MSLSNHPITLHLALMLADFGQHFPAAIVKDIPAQLFTQVFRLVAGSLRRFSEDGGAIEACKADGEGQDIILQHRQTKGRD